LVVSLFTISQTGWYRSRTTPELNVFISTSFKVSSILRMDWSGSSASTFRKPRYYVEPQEIHFITEIERAKYEALKALLACRLGMAPLTR